MLVRSRSLAVFLAAGSVGALGCAHVEPAAVTAAGSLDTPPVLAQVSYQLTVTTRGVSVETAPTTDDAIVGSVTLACLDRGGAAIVCRDERHMVRYEAVLSTPPVEDLALRPYSRLLSELRRVAWNLCRPAQAVAQGAERSVEQQGQLALGGIGFPTDITIRDRLGSVGCDAMPSDKTGRATPCRARPLPQPFVSTLSRKESL